MNKLDWTTPLGTMTLAADEVGLCGAWFAGQAYFGAGVDLDQATVAATPILRRAAAWLDAYFAGARPAVDVPLHAAGTPYRQAVWTALTAIPYGETATYRDLAQAVGGGARAIGGAVGHNPLSLFVPCHRVVATDGALTGYAGGLERKAALLTLEGERVVAGRLVRA
ncbi:methylated-DNA--[protein]-cysteine S-methyltransferase [Lacticaseibacillus kribbianus]|uniref:methylated-DNA--[protein]-cysteine S-methyltransferase n=1 Tax=Lacticaseibacillus kribbianus TaxID=2926292 RepID=UPI001CD71C77|nr:methylated-DNA--[protein]-cysteine S-methyltransferase [Lacticaseibacillus kribbianus]